MSPMRTRLQNEMEFGEGIAPSVNSFLLAKRSIALSGEVKYPPDLLSQKWASW